ncbi:hypothetical protein Esti_001226 [Eimeria stiedai]
MWGVQAPFGVYRHLSEVQAEINSFRVWRHLGRLKPSSKTPTITTPQRRSSSAAAQQQQQQGTSGAAAAAPVTSLATTCSFLSFVSLFKLADSMLLQRRQLTPLFLSSLLVWQQVTCSAAAAQAPEMVAAATSAAADTLAVAGEAAADIVAAAATAGACSEEDLAIIGQQQLMLKELQAQQQQLVLSEQQQQLVLSEQQQQQRKKPADGGFKGAFLSIGRLAGSAAAAAARAHAAALAAADATAAVAAALGQSGAAPSLRFGSSSSNGKHRESLDAAVEKGAEASREAAHAAQYAGAAAAAAAAAANASEAAVIAAATSRQEKKQKTGPRPSTPFLRLLDVCARRALGDGPKTTACLLQQVQQQMQQKVSPGCASCFGTTAACAARHCRRMCFANTCSPQCIECNNVNCNGQLLRCAGCTPQNLPPPCIDS